MKRNFSICLLSIFLGALNIFGAAAQEEKVTLKIVSGHNQLFSETGYWQEPVNDHYFKNMDQLKDKIADWLRVQVRNSKSHQTMHSEEIKLSNSPMIGLEEKDSKIYVTYNLPFNSISFSVTTPEIFGVGLGKTFDPKIYFYFSTIGNFELIQNGTAESIKLLNPNWIIEVTIPDYNRYSSLSFDKDDMFLMSLSFESDAENIYFSLNDIDNILNEYLQANIINKAELIKELEVDENKQLQVNADISTNSLIFQHNFSQTGIVKRSATKDAKIILEKPESASSTPPVSVPVSTSPSGINKGSNVINSQRANNKPSVKLK